MAWADWKEGDGVGVGLVTKQVVNGVKFRRRGITQKKTYNIENTAKFWNQGQQHHGEYECVSAARVSDTSLFRKLYRTHKYIRWTKFRNHFSNLWCVPRNVTRIMWEWHDATKIFFFTCYVGWWLRMSLVSIWGQSIRWGPPGVGLGTALTYPDRITTFLPGVLEYLMPYASWRK